MNMSFTQRLNYRSLNKVRFVERVDKVARIHD
jgi:hypothetical protein